MVEMRNLGSSGLQTPKLVLGGNVFGFTVKSPEAFAILDRFVAAGGMMIDTADVYSAWAPGNRGGESETMLGEWLARRGRRDDVLIATKVGLLAGEGGEKLQAGRIAAAVEASLRRLRTDYIDLYYAHRDDDKTPLDETLGAFDRLVKAGKVRVIGASNYSAERLAQALEVSRREGLVRFEVLQPELNLLVRDRFEGPLQQLCIRENIGVLPYYGLASGFLTGKYRSRDDLGKSVRGGGMSRYLEAGGLAVIDVLEQVARETGGTPAQVALAWVAAQPGVAAPIASATSLGQLDELLGSLEISLSEEQLKRLDAVSRQIALQPA
ncbi:aldo/keto reductase [Sphingomonas sp.]|uniref:aldo/keto reductase n=1 Tax=Sphingomonas sp. TaxID=28214 RepID=UPI002FCBCEBB